MEIAKQIKNNDMNISLSGKFTFQDHEVFKDVLQVIHTHPSNSVILEMGNLQFVDSAALGMLLLAQDEAAKRKKKIILTGLSGQVKKIFDTTRLDRIFTVKQTS